MAITAANMTFLGTGPSGNNQEIAQTVTRGTQALRLVGYATLVGDSGSGNSTSATVNYIDGTKQLTFTPAVIHACRVGGNESTGTIDVVSAVDTASNNTACTVQFTATWTGSIIVGLKLCPA